MALVCLTGYPCSGKTTRAKEIEGLLFNSEQIKANNMSVRLLSESDFGYNPESTPLGMWLYPNFETLDRKNLFGNLFCLLLNKGLQKTRL